MTCVILLRSFQEFCFPSCSATLEQREMYMCHFLGVARVVVFNLSSREKSTCLCTHTHTDPKQFHCGSSMASLILSYLHVWVALGLKSSHTLGEVTEIIVVNIFNIGIFLDRLKSGKVCHSHPPPQPNSWLPSVAYFCKSVCLCF